MLDSNPSGPDNLEEVEAHGRAKQVRDVSYALHLKLQKGASEYEGRIGIRFDYTAVEGAKELFLDFKGKKVVSFVVNGEEKVTKDSAFFSRNRIQFGSFLKAGKVDLQIVYVNDYDHGGDGFHQFVDPEDKQEYLYTMFEPFYCHRWIPCFDQPNLKGELTLSVEAPGDWKVIGNTKVLKVEEKGEVKVHSFTPTPKISTYLYALVVGPYDQFDDVYDQRVPLGIYVRKSLAKFMDHEVVFTHLKQGLKFYEDFFNYKYPFDKYDQLFVPEFNMGAMENVGCVTFTEHYVFKDRPTRVQVANRADTILHECAHMWFGDLVTPVWWDGLWLNESFATYMAALNVSEATEYGQLSWQNFNSSMKSWAYREDQLTTTHPIQGTVVDTDTTALIFDGITYGKGASVLKQLVYMLGMDNFKEGMRNYFKTHAWGNTTIAQFLESVTSTSKNLDPNVWAKEWLSTAGLNTLQLRYESQDGKITSAHIEQSAPETHPTLRSHAAELIVYRLNGDVLAKEDAFKVEVKPEKLTPVPALVGKDVPSFIYLNNNDYAFAKCPLDPKSLEFVLSRMELISDPLLRQLLWFGFYDLVRDAKMKSTDFLDLVSTKIGIETEPKLVTTILARSLSALIHFVPKSMTEEYGVKLFDSVYRSLEAATQPEWKLIWSKNVVEFARRADKVAILLDDVKTGKINFTQDSRWSIAVKAVAWGLPGAEEALTAEREKDKSDTGDRAMLRAKSSVPKAEVKKESWDRFINQTGGLSAHQQAADMSGFRWQHQEKLVEPYIDLFFNSVRTVFQSKDKEYPQAFFGNLFPSDAENPVILEKAKKLLAELTPEEKQLLRMLQEEIDDLERELKCKKLVLSQ
eukprot:TRINITY_DN1372_c0_g1_i1.p1 TRINITY_DN1372_c0_g1~~TRINITY_DN1372_c0_g1_i1.p1  ORF type:complete len:857 (+),score=169.94 TRINITY_DN1372_c0_g1_i1:33-2603(+)